ncbi:MAG TPA: PAS domain S-box protein, partial [Ideonella sp.]|nr:PAS domain S-box protein [Ideonella sp.]
MSAPSSFSSTLPASDAPASASAPARLRGLLALVMTVLALAAWGFFAATDNLAAASAGDAEALNLAGRQALQAERLSAQAVSTASGHDSAYPLGDTLARMMDDAVRLYELRGVWGGNEDDRNHWTAGRERLWAAVQSLQMARERGEPRLEPFLGRVQGEARQFTAMMEQAIGQLQVLAEQRQRQTRRAHALLVGLLAAGVTMLLWALGEPLARRIARDHARLVAQAQQLERLAMVADRTQNGVVITDALGLLVWANQGFTRITGFSPDEVRGRKPASFLQFEGTDPAPREALERALRAAQPVRVEILNRGKHGRSFWVDLDIQPLRDAAGTLTGFIQVTTDITAQVERREYLDAILRALPAGLLVQDAEGRIVDANLKAEQLLGISREHLIGVAGRDSYDPGWAPVRDDGTPFNPQDLPAITTLRTGQAQLDQPVGVRTPDGQRRWLRVNTQILPDPAGATQGVISCFLDETEVRAQRNLLRTTIDGAGVGTWDWDMTSGRIDYNDRWAIMFGFEVNEVPRTLDGWQDLVHPEDAAIARRALHAHLSDADVPYRTEFRMRTK